jgi:hypothetical protein
MHSFCLQDRVTLRGGSAITTITQGENGWLDLMGFEHAVIWLVVNELTAGGGTVTLAYQTAVRPEDDLFISMAGAATTMPFTPAVGVTVTPLFKDWLAVPLARWLRWQLTATGTSSAWDIELEIHVCASGCGRRRAQNGNGYAMHQE